MAVKILRPTTWSSASTELNAHLEQSLLTNVKEVRKVDDYTVDIETNGANPLLPNNLTNLFMMDEGWTISNGSEVPQDFANGQTTYAAQNTNGTGAYTLISRTPDERSVLRANPSYWGVGEYPLQVSEIIFTPIQSAPLAWLQCCPAKWTLFKTFLFRTSVESSPKTT